TERGRTRTERSQPARARCRLHAPVAGCDGEGTNADRTVAGCTRPLQAARAGRRLRRRGGERGPSGRRLHAPVAGCGRSSSWARARRTLRATAADAHRAGDESRALRRSGADADRRGSTEDEGAGGAAGAIVTLEEVDRRLG